MQRLIGQSMAMRIVALLLASAPVAAQHEAHTAPAAIDTVLVARCSQVQPAVRDALVSALARLEQARLSNTPAELRAAVDVVDRALRDVQVKLEPCVSLRPQAVMAAPHSHGPSSGAAMSSGSTEPAPSVPALAGAAESKGDPPMKDPRCTANIDPRIAPQASHAGQSYYFCSERDRQRFLADPAAYLRGAPAPPAPGAGHVH